MAGCRHHSGYLADDEAGHSKYMARVQPPKKPLLPDMGPAFKLGCMPHPPSTDGNSAFWNHRQARKGPQAFGSFLDFLTVGQVLDSLQSVVEEAAGRVASTKTEAGVPLVEVQDPMALPRRGQQTRARPSYSTVKRHRVRPSLFTGHPNNYPSCSSSMSDSRGSLRAGCLGTHSQGSDLSAQGFSSLPPIRDRLLEKNLKRLLHLENKGKVWSQTYSQRDSLLWDSLGSQTSSQWIPEQPLPWFPGWLGSSTGSPKVSELGPRERDLIFLKGQLNTGMTSLLSQPESFDLPAYCAVHEPHHMLDFLAKHQLFPAMQSVVSQAVDKLMGARRRDGYPLFPTNPQPTSAPRVIDSPGLPDSELAVPAEGEINDFLPSTVYSPKIPGRKNKSGWGSPSVSNAHEANRYKLKNSNARFTKKKPLPSISPKSSMSALSNPWFEEIVDFLVERAVTLLILKYKFEKNLNKQLGFISFPITEALMDLFLGFKKVKGTKICLSSQMDWSCLLRKLQEAESALQASKHASRSQSSQPCSTLKPGSPRLHTSQLEASWHSTKASSIQPVPATGTDQDQASEPGLLLDTELSIYQLLSPQEPTAAKEQVPTSLSEPRLSMSSALGMGFSSPKSKEVESTEDSEGNDGDEDEDEGSKEDKDDMDSLEDESNLRASRSPDWSP
ncbi:coiled-coil domain-containing protein 116 [Ctenodactylus gundi]